MLLSISFSGGGWTHTAQHNLVVANAFICRHVDENYTPVRWIKETTPIILQLLLLIASLIYLEGAVFLLV